MQKSLQPSRDWGAPLVPACMLGSRRVRSGCVGKVPKRNLKGGYHQKLSAKPGQQFGASSNIRLVKQQPGVRTEPSCVIQNQLAVTIPRAQVHKIQHDEGRDQDGVAQLPRVASSRASHLHLTQRNVWREYRASKFQVAQHTEAVRTPNGKVQIYRLIRRCQELEP